MDRPKICTTRLADQHFGMCISPKDVLMPFFNGHGTNYYRPWKMFNESAQDVGSTIETNDKFKVTLDVQHFKPEEINVRVNERQIIIEGKHEEREDAHGYISRQFIRRYTLPSDCPSETITSTLSSDGVLTITGNKVIREEMKGEKIVPIQLCSSKKEEIKTEVMKNGSCNIQMGACAIEKKDVKATEIAKEEVKKETEVAKKEMRREIDKKDMIIDKMETKNIKTDTAIEKKDVVLDKKMEKNDLMKTNTTIEKREIKTEDKEKKEAQTKLKEEHSRLLKPELLKDAVSTTEKLISESRKEADELLKLLTPDKTVQASTSAASEKLEEVLGHCKTAIAELKKEKIGESMMSSETSSFKSSTMSEMIETKESASFMSMSSSMKASSERSSDIISEIMCAELKEAAENI